MKPRTGFLAALLVAILIGIGAVYSRDRIRL
jgi:hypothetical protein